tara:strand:- start:22 stop:285 length:264 start_codon:yes stop_codon:yes gene_type:complete
MTKPKLMVFKCKGVGVPNDLPMCTNTITTDLEDKRIDKRGGYYYELFGKKMFMPKTRTYRCKDCSSYVQQWEQKVHNDLAKKIAKYL